MPVPIIFVWPYFALPLAFLLAPFYLKSLLIFIILSNLSCISAIYWLIIFYDDSDMLTNFSSAASSSC